jgi:hypothetical protein
MKTRPFSLMLAVIAAAAACSSYAQDDLPFDPVKVLVDLEGDGKVESIVWRKLGEDEEIGTFHQILVKDANGAILWKSPAVMKEDHPLAFGEFHFGITLPQWAGDVDGDGAVELIVPAPQSDVSPCFFRLFRWKESAFEPVQSRALASEGADSKGYVWTETPAPQGRWVQKWIGRSAEGGHVVEIVSLPENGPLVTGIGVIQPKDGGFEVVRWITPPMVADRGEELTYRARLSEKDHSNSSGLVLKGVLEIIRQDRANVHRSLHTDEEDGFDDVFNSPEARERMGRMTLDVSGGKRAEEQILNGTPLVEVRVLGSTLLVEVIKD